MERFYTVLFSHPAVEAITWWDFADAMAWQQAPAGLVRKDLTPKPAYERLKGLIKGKWWTNVSIQSAEDGAAKFRGFLGTYRLTAGMGDAARTAGFRLDRSAKGPIEVRVK